MTPITALSSALLLIGLVLIGRKRRNGFMFSVFGEAGWTGVAMAGGMYDLAAVCLIFGGVALFNFFAWSDK